MVRISVEEATFERLQDHAQPLVDNSDAVINRALDALEALYQQTGIPGLANGPETDSERRIDSQRLPDLMHTKVLDATIGGELVPQPNWNLLLRRIVRVSKEYTKTFDDLNRLCPANMVHGRKQDKGYHYLPEIDVSVQAQPANAACLAIVTTAQKLGIALDIGFMWRNKEGATHPGDHARIRTTGSKSRPEDRAAFHTEEFRKPEEPTKKILFLRGPSGSGVTARGYEERGSFIVSSGSKANKKESPSISPSYSSLRKDLFRQGVFEDAGPVYRVVRNYPFRSPSAASSALLGRESNGRTEWRDAYGRPLKEIQEGRPESRDW